MIIFFYFLYFFQEPFPEEIRQEINIIPPLNTRKATREDMLTETRDMLDAFFTPFNKRLRDILNDDRFVWDRRLNS